MIIDPVYECGDNQLVALTMLGISERHEFFAWKYWRQSQWYKDSYGANLLITEVSRCHEKLSKDFAFINVMMMNNMVAVSTMSRQYDNVDQLAIIGTFTDIAV